MPMEMGPFGSPQLFERFEERSPFEERSIILSYPEHYYWVFRVKESGSLSYGNLKYPDARFYELVEKFDNDTDAQAFCNKNKRSTRLAE